MFDFGVGYTELLVIAVVALIVVGPKDLPKLLRHLGQFTASRCGARRREFQRHLDEVAREADVDKVTSEIREATKIDLGEGEIRKAAADLRTALENTTPAADPHAPATASSPPSTAAPSPGAGAPASLPEAAVPEIPATEVPPPEATAPEVTPQPAPADKAPDRAL